jgi:hypothetical protein
MIFKGTVMESMQLPYRIMYPEGYFRQLPYMKNSAWIVQVAVWGIFLWPCKMEKKIQFGESGIFSVLIFSKWG